MTVSLLDWLASLIPWMPALLATSVMCKEIPLKVLHRCGRYLCRCCSSSPKHRVHAVLLYDGAAIECTESEKELVHVAFDKRMLFNFCHRNKKNLHHGGNVSFISLLLDFKATSGGCPHLFETQLGVRRRLSHDDRMYHAELIALLLT